MTLAQARGLPDTDYPSARALFGISLPLVAVLATTVPYAEIIDCQSDVNREPAGLDNVQIRKHSELRHELAEQETGRR